MTLTEAVNQMLAVIGEAPVADASTTELLEAQQAVLTLTQVSREVQTKGWAFNTERDVTLTPDATSGYIELTGDVLKVDSEARDVIQRGTRLFDRTTNGFSFAAPLVVELVRELGFDELPPAAQHYVVIKAARRFQKRWLGSEKLDAFTKEEELDALLEMQSAELEAADYNYIYGAPTTVRVLTRK